MRVLLTGGAGYIGSHTASELLNAGHDVTVVDNLANGSRVAVRRAGRLANGVVAIHEDDLLDTRGIERTFEAGPFDAVVHFAGLKAVGESVAEPLRYYRINLTSTMNLVETMLAQGVRHLVFSSSATVYGDPERVPIDETCAVHDASNPYGRTKLFLERILEDVVRAHPDMNVARLRYFNPAGAHPSGDIGEDPSGIPNNLLPYVTQVAVGRRDILTVNGDAYPTPDGTCIRDYLHVTDLARAHVAGRDKLATHPGLVTYNLGTGRGQSVYEVIRAYERATGVEIPFRVGPRRAGDIPTSYTDPSLAEAELGWRAEKTIEDICRSAHEWQTRNPTGYPED